MATRIPVSPFIARSFLGASLVLGAASADAKIVEAVIELPVQVADQQGVRVSHAIKVTIFRDDARTGSPFLILNHGRAPHEADRVKLGRAKYSANARYFVDKGFAVFVPTRVGYGVTSGPDVENSGACGKKNYPPVYEAAAQQSLKVIEHAKTLPYIDPSKGLLVGQSFGGTVAITLAAKNIPGVMGAINFAGGGGGNPETRPGRPCRDDLLTRLFAAYGATAKIPTLWLYSENDRYFGIEKPRAWFKAFVDRGGTAKFVQLPPFESDGHRSFTGNPAAWQPAFEDFLRACCAGKI